MAKRNKYSAGPDIPAGETVRDSAGHVVDDAYVENAVEDAIQRIRPRGRPSLSDSGESPLLRVRISRELEQSVDEAARAAGTSRAEWVRQVLTRAAQRAS